jgi:ABC-2 type transport system ATP-binding protein
MSATLVSRSADPAIEVRALVKRYADVVAVNGVDLEVRAGECFGLLGPNGAGKTTTIEILEGLTRPDAGDVAVLGQRWTGGPDRALRERLGIQLQETKLQEKVTVLETIELFRSFYRNGPAPDEVLRRVALEEQRNAWVVKLSGGQRQRLSLACALVNDPELLFLYEPTTGLDPQSRRQLRSDRGVSARKAARRCSPPITWMRPSACATGSRSSWTGRGSRLDCPAEADRRARRRERHRVLDRRRADFGTVERLPSVRQARREAAGFALIVDEPHVAIPELLAELERQHVVLQRLTTHHATLEDVFVSMTGRTLRDE